MLYKQILSDQDTISPIPEKFLNDDEVITTINDFCVYVLRKCLNEAATIFDDINSYNFNGIFTSSLTSVNEISNAVFGHWGAVIDGWRKEYEERTPLKSTKSYEKYNEDMSKALKNKLSFSLAEIQHYGEMFKTDDCIGNITEYLKNEITEKINSINSNYALAKELLTSGYNPNNVKELKKDKHATGLLKNLLDSIKELEYFLKTLKGTGKEENKDFSFYGEFDQLYGNISEIDLIYDKLLDSKEKERDNARKNWDTIENIKELKEGYLSQVIHQICEYVVEYDAIIAMEDLNFGFKKGRFKVEKQVYQKFENMLCEKLKYLVRKDEAPENPGGLLNAYQLTNQDDKYSKKQNGIIFYVPAWLTSKIDPVTGFVDLLKPKYVSVKSALEFIERIDDIRFNKDENMFEFDIDYSKFPKAASSYRKKWTVCTNGERIINERIKEKNNMWDSKVIVLTDEFEKLFTSYSVDYSNNIKENILKITDSNFHRKFIKLLSYTLQLRNSVTNNTDIDYLLSPVKDEKGVFYDSRRCDASLPESADANGAYNIARKALWAISVLQATDEELLNDTNLSIKNSVWLEYAQK